MHKLRVFCVSMLAGFSMLSCLGLASEPAKVEKASLVRRPDEVAFSNGYGGSGYSFKLRTNDDEVHRNYVDICYSNCQELHLRMVADQSNRVTDLGSAELAAAPDQAPADATWHALSFDPEVGHVYLLQVAEDTERMTVKVRIDALTDKQVDFSWTVAEPLSGGIDRTHWGKAGAMGMCGAGRHGPDHVPGLPGAGGVGGLPNP